MGATKELQTNFIVDLTPWRNIIRKKYVIEDVPLRILRNFFGRVFSRNHLRITATGAMKTSFFVQWTKT